MPALSRQTRSLLLIFIACSVLAFAVPTWQFVRHVYHDAHSRGSGGTFTETIRFERRGDVYSGVAVGSVSPAPASTGEVVGTATIVLGHFTSVDETGRPVRTEDTFVCTWSPSSPSDEAIDGIVRTWGRPPQSPDNTRFAVESNLAPFTLAEVLKSPSGGGVKRHWGPLLAQALSKTSDGYMFCGFFFVSTGIAIYLTLRQKARRGNVCWKCGYSTVGLAGHICPECGTDLSRARN